MRLEPRTLKVLSWPRRLADIYHEQWLRQRALIHASILRLLLETAPRPRPVIYAAPAPAPGGAEGGGDEGGGGGAAAAAAPDEQRALAEQPQGDTEEEEDRLGLVAQQVRKAGV